MKRVLSFLLCLIFVLTLSVPAFAQEAVEEDAIEKPKTIDVWVWAKDIPQGTLIRDDDIVKVSVKNENIPANAITDSEKLVHNYARRNLYAFEYASDDQISANSIKKYNADILKKQITKSKEDYVFVTDYITPGTGDDLFSFLQDIIDNNPNRTIYFPDGEYVISESLCVSANPKESVAIQLSDGATIKAAANWRNRDCNALICLGATPRNDIKSVGHYFVVSGGTLDGANKANGIHVKSGRECVIRNICIKNALKGIAIDYGVNSGSSDYDFEDITIIGNGMPATVGIHNEGYDNTYTNVRIYDMATGFLNERGGEIANIYVTYTEKSANLKQEKVGIDTGGRMSHCYVVNADKAFRLRNTAITFECTAIWTSSDCKKQTAFDCGNGILLSGCKAYFAPGEGVNTKFTTKFGKDDPKIEACFQ